MPKSSRFALGIPLGISSSFLLFSMIWERDSGRCRLRLKARHSWMAGDVKSWGLPIRREHVLVLHTISTTTKPNSFIRLESTLLWKDSACMYVRTPDHLSFYSALGISNLLTLWLQNGRLPKLAPKPPSPSGRKLPYLPWATFKIEVHMKIYYFWFWSWHWSFRHSNKLWAITVTPGPLLFTKRRWP